MINSIERLANAENVDYLSKESNTPKSEMLSLVVVLCFSVLTSFESDFIQVIKSNTHAGAVNVSFLL